MRALAGIALLAVSLSPARADEPSAGAELDRWNAEIVAQIRAKKPRHVVISAAAAAELERAGMRLLKLARVVPVIVAGKPAGFEISKIRAGSIPAALGFRNGDAVDQINGLPVRDLGELMAAYKKVAKARRLDVRLRRRGKPIYLRIDIAR